jgi:hypothetical protein
MPGTFRSKPRKDSQELDDPNSNLYISSRQSAAKFAIAVHLLSLVRLGVFSCRVTWDSIFRSLSKYSVYPSQLLDLPGAERAIDQNIEQV